MDWKLQAVMIVISGESAFGIHCILLAIPIISNSSVKTYFKLLDLSFMWTIKSHSFWKLLQKATNKKLLRQNALIHCYWATSFIKRQKSGTSSDNEWCNEWQLMATSDNEWQRVVQRMTASDNEWYNEWLRMEWNCLRRTGFSEKVTVFKKYLHLKRFLFWKSRCSE